MSSVQSSDNDVEEMESCAAKSSTTSLYKDKPEWRDVEPILSVDGDDGETVVPILYSEKFKDAFSYIWAVYKSGELSPRVLDLTADAIQLDVAHYTVWQLRRDVLEALKVPHLITDLGLGSEFEKEFAFTAEILEEHEKNYQPWQHQKALVSWAIGYLEGEGNGLKVTSPEILAPILEQELKLTERMLNNDAKNYHAWQHRQWILYIFKGSFPNLAGEEMAFIKKMLETDVRNNSAWNQKHFVFSQMIRDFSEDALVKEIGETWEFVKVALNNESAWSYLRGIVELADLNFMVTLQKDVVSLCKPLLKNEEGVLTSSRPMVVLYIEFVNELLCAGMDEYIKEYKEVLGLLDNLVSTDPIRSQYWELVKHKFVEVHSEVAEPKTCCQPS